MDQKPVFLTPFALARVLKGFAQTLGLTDSMADVTAQAFLQDHPGVERWSTFLSKNCANCLLDPGTCEFLNPTHGMIGRTTTPREVQAGTALAVETGGVRNCPMRSPS